MHKDPYCDFLHSNVVEATPERAVVAQPNLNELNNHVAVRHAGALYTAAYAASKSLVRAAAGDDAEIELVASDVRYTNFPSGDITSTAEPQGEGWDALSSDGPAAEAAGSTKPIELGVKVVAANAAGKPVVDADVTWRISRRR